MATLALLLAGLSTFSFLSTHPETQAKILDVSLIAGHRQIKGSVISLGKLSASTKGALETQFGHQLISIESNRIIARSSDRSKTNWRFEAPDLNVPVIYQSDQDCLYVASTSRKKPEPLSNKAVWKVRLATGKLDRQYILPELRAPWILQEVTSVLSGPQGVAILSTIKQTTDDWDFKKEQNACLSFYSHDGQLKWQQRWSQAPETNAKGWLLASAYPNFSDTSIVHLQWAHDKIVMCATPSEPLRVVDTISGKESTSIERIWEFRRGFEGPSVWSHFIERGGYKGLLNAFKKDKVFPKDDSIDGKIMSGPEIVPISQDQFLVYVIVFRSHSEPFGEYAGDSFLYELMLDDSGEMRPLSITPLPQYPRGRGWKDGKSVTWLAQNNSIFRVSPSERVISREYWEPGSSDLLGQIDWFRQFTPIGVRAWLRCDRTTELAVFFNGKAISASGPMYVVRKGDSTMHFPLATTDLRTGLRRQFEITFRLDRPIPMPQSNYGQQGEVITTLGTYYLGIDRLHVAGQRLQFIAGSEERVYRVEFNIRKILDVLRLVPES